jgi:hypothetical protein
VDGLRGRADVRGCGGLQRRPGSIFRSARLCGSRLSARGALHRRKGRLFLDDTISGAQIGKNTSGLCIMGRLSLRSSSHWRAMILACR